MLFWKSLWATVLVVTLSPLFFMKASTTAAYARLGTSSDEPEPKVSVLDAVAGVPPVPVQAASAANAPSPTAPETRARRVTVPAVARLKAPKFSLLIRNYSLVIELLWTSNRVA